MPLKTYRDEFLTTLTVTITLVAVWWAASAYSGSPLLPGPVNVLRRTFDILLSREAVLNVGISTLRVSIAVGASVVLGGAFGLLPSAIKHSRIPVLHVSWLCLATPSLIWVLLSILWFGLSDAGKVVVICCLTVPQMSLSVAEGARSVDAGLLEMCRLYAVPTSRRLLWVVLPSVATHVAAALGTCIGTSWRILVLAEALGGTDGVGARIMNAADRVNILDVFAWSIVTLGMSLTMQFTAKCISGRLLTMLKLDFSWQSSGS